MSGRIRHVDRQGLQPSATTSKPMTDEANNIHLVTMVCWKTLSPGFLGGCNFDIYSPPNHCRRPTFPNGKSITLFVPIHLTSKPNQATTGCTGGSSESFRHRHRACWEHSVVSESGSRSVGFCAPSIRPVLSRSVPP